MTLHPTLALVWRQTKLMATILVVCALCFTLLAVEVMATGEGKGDSDYITYHLPIVSAFLHVDYQHLEYNLIVLFFLMLPNVNQNYVFQDFIKIIALMSVVLIPFDFIIQQVSVGISGVVYFLFARACLSSNHRLIRIFFVGMMISEIAGLGDFSDEYAQQCHVLGALLGWISLKTKHPRLQIFLSPASSFKI
jgi:membrane associated rhomboid family serine protease